MKYSYPAFAILPDGSIWYYITQFTDENKPGTRMFLAAESSDPYWYSLETGERMVDVDIGVTDAVLAKFFAKEAGLDWYAD